MTAFPCARKAFLRFLVDEVNDITSCSPMGSVSSSAFFHAPLGIYKPCGVWCFLSDPHNYWNQRSLHQRRHGEGTRCCSTYQFRPRWAARAPHLTRVHGEMDRSLSRCPVTTDRVFGSHTVYKRLRLLLRTSISISLPTSTFQPPFPAYQSLSSKSQCRANLSSQSPVRPARRAVVLSVSSSRTAGSRFAL